MVAGALQAPWGGHGGRLLADSARALIAGFSAMTADPQHHSPGPEKGPVVFVRRWAGILMAAARNWLESQAFIYGAALAFFTVFSIAPVIIVIVALIGFFLGEQTVRDELINQRHAMLGSDRQSTRLTCS